MADADYSGPDRSQPRRRSLVILPMLLMLVATTAQRTRAADLDKQFVKHAPEVMKYLQEKGYKNVGVLKFIIKKDSRDNQDDKSVKTFSDRVGSLNIDGAKRLETALILANRPQHPIGIIHDASQVAAKTPGANHLTAEGRKKLFGPKYPLAWGKQTVTADAFIVGSIEVSADLKQMTIRIAAFGADSKLEKVTDFVAAMAAENLAEAGESFVLRGAFDKGNIEQVALNDAAKVKDSVKENPPPLKSADAPVSLEITYDGQLTPLETRDGKTFVREPQEGQQVVFTLKRKNPADTQRYAAVLKVNGENTLGKQKLRDLQCRKWVLEPKDPPIVVRGYQTTDSQAEAFRVLSKEESKGREIDYGEDVGTISLVVFREKTSSAKPPADLPDDDADDIAALTRNIFPPKPAENLAALQAQFRGEDRRGLIGQGQTIETAIRTVKFESDPVPVMSATVIYYKP